jgi:hypothetical protein
MVQTCSKCSRANPADAVYCYFDGFVLGGHARNGAAAAVRVFAHPFVFPSGRQCRSFDELALGCQEDWAAACDLLHKGYLKNFFSGLGRADLALAAAEAARFPDPDRGLDQLLAKLPTEALDEPRLRVQTLEINLGVLAAGQPRDFQLHLENQGMRLLYGTITCVEGDWLALGDSASQKHFQFLHEWSLPIRVRPDKLRANRKPLEAHLEVESNGGSFIVAVRARVPIRPFPPGVLAGAQSPRQVAEKAKAHTKEAAALFEGGAVAQWYRSNGWTYPVQGPSASGLGAVQQFFEALGLTAPPKVEISTSRIDLFGKVGDRLRQTIEIKSEEKRPVYAHAVSNQPWLEVGPVKLNGRRAAFDVSVPSVPDCQGETLTAKLVVQSNGNQRFVVPVSLQISHNLAFGDPPPAPPAVGGFGGRQQGLDVGDPNLVPAARLPDVLSPAVPVGDVSGGVEDRLVIEPECIHGSLRGRAMGPVRNTMRETGGEPVTFFSSLSGEVTGQAVDRHPEPASGVRPVLLGGGGGDAERRGRLLDGEAGEEPELDRLGLARVLRFELPEGLVQGEQAVAVPLFPGRLDLVEVEAATSAPGLAGLLVPGPVDQDPAHGLGGGEEVPAAVPVLGLLPAHQPQVRLVYQRGRLQRLSRLLLGQPLRRQLAQLS